MAISQTDSCGVARCCVCDCDHLQHFVVFLELVGHLPLVHNICLSQESGSVHGTFLCYT